VSDRDAPEKNNSAEIGERIHLFESDKRVSSRRGLVAAHVVSSIRPTNKETK